MQESLLTPIRTTYSSSAIDFRFAEQRNLYFSFQIPSLLYLSQ